MQRSLLLWLGIGWAQYASPGILGGGGFQSLLPSELLTANPATAFPERRWAVRAATAFYLPAPELSFRMGGGSFSWDTLQAISLIAQQWGFDKITQSEVGIGYGLRLLNQRLSLSVRGRLLSTNFSEYGRLYKGTPDVGFTFRLAPRLLIGGFGYNLLAQGWGWLPGQTIYGFGAAYVPSGSAQLLAEIIQQPHSPLQVQTAFIYVPYPLLTLRGGVGIPVLRAGGGFSLAFKGFTLDAGYLYQPATGGWTAIGVSFLR